MDSLDAKDGLGVRTYLKEQNSKNATIKMINKISLYNVWKLL